MNACGIFSKVSPVCLARTLTSLALLNLCSLCSTFSFKVSPASDKSYRGLLCVCSAALCSRLSESSPPPQADVGAPLCSSPRPAVLLPRFLAAFSVLWDTLLCLLLKSLHSSWDIIPGHRAGAAVGPTSWILLFPSPYLLSTD